MLPIATSHRKSSRRPTRSVALGLFPAFRKATNDSAVLYNANFWVESPECSPQAALAAAKASKGDYLSAKTIFTKEVNDSAVFLYDRFSKAPLRRD